MGNSADIVEKWFERVWSNEDEDAIDDMLVPETMAVGLGSQPRVGPEQFKEFHRCFVKLMTNFDIVIDKQLRKDDWFSTLVTFNATRRDNGQPVTMTGHAFCRIVDDKIVEGYNHFDMLGLFGQLDLLPTDTMDRCLVGEKCA